MDGLSAATTVVSVLQTAWQVINYVKAVKGAGEERRKLLLELVRARGLLATLRDVTEDVGNDEWSQALQSLHGPNGPLDAFRLLLEEIMDEMGIERAPEQPNQTRQSVSVVSKLRRSTLLGCFQRNYSSSSTSTAPSKGPEAFEHPPDHHHSTVAIKLGAAVKDLKWPFTQPHLQELLNTLERIKTQFLVALSSDNVRLSKLIRDDLQTVHGDVLVVKDDTFVIREHQEGSKEWTSEQRLIFRSIATLDFSSHTLSPRHLEQLKRSAGWFLRHDRFRQWRTDGSSLLLIGNPGTGKTSICKVVESFLQASGPSSEVFLVAVYFSTTNRPEDQSLQAVLAFIVEHILRVRPQFQKYYNKLMLTGEGQLEVADSLRIIHRARQDFQRFYILLDGLDECDQEQVQEVVQRLTGLRTRLRIFATSRLYPTLLPNLFSYNIMISDEMVSDDIRVYVREALLHNSGSAIRDFLENDAEDSARVVETIVAQSEGVFLLAKLLLEQLRTATNRRNFHRMLEQNPRSVEDLYASCLRKLTGQDECDARLGKRVLKQLFAADQAIGAEELIDALADEAGWEAGDRTRVEERVNRCVECCMGFAHRDAYGSVAFAHITVRHFLQIYGIPD